MENRITSYDVKNFIIRIFSAILFVPFIIVPIILKGYFLYLFYIFLLSLMVIELIDMSKISKKKFFIYLYLLICLLTVFTFILLILSSENGNFKIIEIILTIWIFDTSLYYLEIHNNLYMLLFLVIPVIILSFLGDLIVSVLKRSVNIKDSGYIIPGHGGIIDRMDSFVTVFLFFGIYSIIFVR